MTVYAESIGANGYRALEGALIDSGGSDISIVLRGADAGFESTLICRDGSVCNLECQGNACSGMMYQCEGNAVCNLDGCDGDLCPQMLAVDIERAYLFGDGGHIQTENVLAMNMNVMVIGIAMIGMMCMMAWYLGMQSKKEYESIN